MNTIRYHRTTRLLHWTQAALLIGMLTLGWWMVTLDYTNRWYTSALFWHRVCGLLVVPIAVLQLWCRRRHPMPPLVHDWRRVGADAMHRLFLLLDVFVSIERLFAVDFERCGGAAARRVGVAGAG